MGSPLPRIDTDMATSRSSAPARPGQRGRPGGRIPVTVHALDPISREGARGQLRRRPEIELREDSEAGPDTVALLISDILDDDAVARLRRIMGSGQTRAVLVVGSLHDAKLLDVLGIGIGAIVWRHEATEDRLAQAVMAAARGDGELPADLLGRLIDQVNVLHRMAAGRAGLPGSGLSPREVDVVRLVADGLGTSEIAAKLSYSDRTIKNILHELTTRLHLRNRAHAVAYALREGYI
ncbi:response regulator transcription factor [Streptomyces mayteni]